MNNLPDKYARDAAIDPSQSFIVQAPAGSGKTSLLTQRFLALLSKVNQPEKIIAITFTKKAASEMRERIMQALESALKAEPSEDYLKTTYHLAKNALAQDKKHDWRLLENPSRLRIQTIDSLCHFLTAKMPLLSKSIPYSSVSDDCTLLYQQAAINCINEALDNDLLKDSANGFLMHLGNHLPRAIELLQSLLPMRDQWLGLLLHFKHHEGDGLDKAVCAIQAMITENVFSHLDDIELETINQLIEYRKAFSDDDIETISQMTFANTKSIAKLFLTGKGLWRKRFTVKEGFPSESSFKHPEEKLAAKAIKQTLKTLLESLSERHALLNELVLANLLPLNPYSQVDLQCLNDLFNLLPRLVAHLQLVFSEHGSVDFTEISTTANQALGDEIATDLDLYLDYQIEHLLIDEFQDTSISQFELVSKIIRNWEAHDHRTLFIVGDPMQSIYRFRQADVGLFLQAQESGIEQKKLTPLNLSCNFRSNKPIIDWVNQTCEKLFPIKDDHQLGAVSYHPSQTLNQKDAKISALAFGDELAQAKKIIDIIHKNPKKQIAILVNGRNQLRFLAPYLKKQSIAIQGVDLEKLTNTRLIDNLWSLTQSLLYPFEKSFIANLLVSPFCGISFDELLTLDELDFCNYRIATDKIHSTDLSTESKERVSFLYQTLNHYQKRCYRDAFHHVVGECFDTLSGQKIIGDEGDNVDTFFSLLATQKKYPLNIDELELAVSKLYSNDKNAANVSVMTIHKSKGLEFDIVIMRSLKYSGKINHQRLFKTLDIMDDDASRHFLISPIKSSFDISNPLYDFISHIDKQKDANEKLRLLYVAITRAKEALYLFSATADIAKAKTDSFLFLLSNHIAFNAVYEEVMDEAIEKTSFFRLKQDSYQALKLQTPPPAYNPAINHHYDKERLIGTLIHEIICHITESHLYSYEQAANNELLASQISHSPLKEEDYSDAQSRIDTVLRHLFSCEKGRWIIEPHQKAKSEYELSTADNNYIIDRTFIDNNTRWIIDYKISEHIKDTPSHYIKQLDNYALLMSEIDTDSLGKSLPIRVALYYPLVKTFISWTPAQYKQSKSVEISENSL